MDARSRLYRVVEETDTFSGRVFDWVVLALIVYSILTLTIETLPNLAPATQRLLWYSEVVVTAIFTIEYGLRVYVAKRKHDYVFSFGGVIDLVAIAPFYVTLLLGLGGIDLRGVRAFRLLRIVRLLKLNRYNKAIRRANRAFQLVREELALYVLLTLILLYVSATGIYYFENPVQPELFASVAHSLWWAVSTLSTVGYGDVYPITLGGRIFTFFVLMVGLGIIAVPAGLVASAFSQARREEAHDPSSD